MIGRNFGGMSAQPDLSGSRARARPDGNRRAPIGHPERVSDRESPVSRIWKRAKENAPRQKAIATTTHAVRRTKPRTPAAAREALIAEAARHGVDDLSDKELAVMTDAVTLSAREAAGEAVSKGRSGVKSLWTTLQTTKPAWIELPDNIAALNLRSDQKPVEVEIVIEVPGVVERLDADLSADAQGARTFNVWLAIDPATTVTAVCVGSERLGRVPQTHAPVIREELHKRRFWTTATLVDGTVSVRLPDHA